MKRLKKILSIILVSFMIFSLTACVGPKTETSSLSYEYGSIRMEFQLTATDDIVERITQRNTTDCSMYSEAQLTEWKDSVSTFYTGIDGVIYTSEISGTDLIETIEVDAAKPDTLKTLSEKGLLPLDSDSSVISLEKTVQNLTAKGWVLSE